MFHLPIAAPIGSHNESVVRLHRIDGVPVTGDLASRRRQAAPGLVAAHDHPVSSGVRSCINALFDESTRFGARMQRRRWRMTMTLWTPGDR